MGTTSGQSKSRILIGGTMASGGEAMAGHFGLPGTGPARAARLADLVGQELGVGTPGLPGARDMAEKL